MGKWLGWEEAKHQYLYLADETQIMFAPQRWRAECNSIRIQQSSSLS
jgi:hypothetical protein